MATMPTGYVRKGKAVCLQLDFDALDMLRELAPTQKCALSHKSPILP